MPGFRKPTTTPTPDDIFDEWLSVLSFAELKVLLYIVRRTFGFGKDSDAISLRQICEGIKTRDGRVLDRGTGLSRKAAFQATQSLETKRLINVGRAVAEDGVNQVNIYSLVFEEDESGGVGTSGTHGSYRRYLGVGTTDYSQQTVSQETDSQETERSNSNNRIPHQSKNRKFDEARLTLTEYIVDLAAEFLDTAPAGASTTRVVNLYRKSGLSLEAFIDRMTEARAVTKEWTGNIKARTKEGDKSKMAYFFGVLEGRLGMRDVP